MNIFLVIQAAAAATTQQIQGAQQPRRGSLLRAAAELAKSFENTETIAFHPKSKWTDLPTTKELMHEKGVVRDRLGWEVDFHDFKMPFMNNVSKRLEQMTLPEVKI